MSIISANLQSLVLYPSCKACVKQYYQANKEVINEKGKQWRQANKEVIAEKKKQYRQANKKAIAEQQKQCYQANKESVAKKKKQYYQANKETITKKRKQHYQANKETVAEKQKQYREANKEAIAEYMKQYQKANKKKILKYRKDRKSKDPSFRMISNLRRGLWSAMNGTRKPKKTMEFLGCSRKQFRKHLSAQFTDGMTLEKLRRRWLGYRPHHARSKV